MKDNGHYRCYEERKFTSERLAFIDTANSIIQEYESQGMSLTLRQLYYQFVARGFIENSDRSYDRLGSVINDGRMAGLVSWTAIEDRTRSLMGLRTYDSPATMLKSVASGYRRDLWSNQPMRPEVWVEKEALVGVLESVCNELRVDFFAVRGYNSQSEQWRAGRRFAGRIAKGQRPVVFHLGDHDPSGIDMTRDNQERLSLFAGTQVLVQRLALNMDQIEALNPPPNPAKLSDSRAGDYIRRFGDRSWELDALDPKTIRDLIRDAILRIRDESLWNLAVKREQEDREVLREMIKEVGGEDAE